MLKYILILVIGAFSFTANAQAKLDIELKTGLLLIKKRQMFYSH